MREKSRYSIPLAYKNQVKSLCWVNNYLIDLVGGLTTFQLTGEIGEIKINHAYRFDGAVSTLDGEYSVIYENFGTKGLILKQGNHVREINRSYYCAHVYEFPVTIFSYDKQIYLAYCPDDYNIIEIEEIETGKRITQKDRLSHDFFQSRLQVSPDKKWLLSAGWVWHPFDAVEIYNLSEGLTTPVLLSQFQEDIANNIGPWEAKNAMFTDDSKLLMSGAIDSTSQEKAIVLYDLENKTVLSMNMMEETAGKLMQLTDTYAIGFYEYPKLINFKTGKIEQKWINIKTDKRNSSIIDLSSSEKLSHIALDPLNKRFAVATEESIEVVVFE